MLSNVQITFHNFKTSLWFSVKYLQIGVDDYKHVIIYTNNLSISKIFTWKTYLWILIFSVRTLNNHCSSLKKRKHIYNFLAALKLNTENILIFQELIPLTYNVLFITVQKNKWQPFKITPEIENFSSKIQRHLLNGNYRY